MKLKAIASALKDCDGVILATDCDREAQLIGQEILEHLRYGGPSETPRTTGTRSGLQGATSVI